MQTHKKLKARILSLALSAAMVTTMMPMNVFAAESGNVVIGTSSIDASSIGTIESFDKLEDRFTPSVGENAPDHVYALSVALNTPVEDLNLPDELTAMVKRTTVTAPAEDEPVVDSGKPSTPAEDEVTPDEDKSDENVTVPGEDADIDDTVSGNQPASPSEATKEVKEEIKGEDVPLAPEPEQDETVVTTVKQESIPVTWQSNKEYKSDENGKFIYTAVLTEDYILADGVELPQIYVMVGRQARGATTSTDVGTADALNSAISSATGDTTIKLINTIDLGNAAVKIPTDKTITLDLNSKTLTSASSPTISVDGNSNFTVTDSSGAKAGVLKCTAIGGIAILSETSGIVTVSGGTVEALSNAINNNNNGNITVSGGILKAAIAISNSGTGEITVSGGIVEATLFAINNASTGSVKVSGGKVEGTLCAINNASTGKITISGSAVVTSSTTDSERGTICLIEVPANAPLTVLDIQGGTVENTANPVQYAVYFTPSNVTSANLSQYYTKAEDATVTGKIKPAATSTASITIGTQPAASTTETYGAISGSLTVAGTASNNNTVSYQWYQNNTNSTTGGTAVTGATNASFTIPTALDAGTYYYYCVLKATDCADKASNVATVTVNKANATEEMKTVATNVSKDGKAGATVSLPTKPAGATYGTPTVSGTITMTDTSISGDTLTYTAPASTTGQTGVITIPVTTATNYNDYSITVTITSVEKTPVTISGLSAVTGLIYNGNIQKGYTGTISVEGNKVPVNELLYTYTSTDSGTYNSSTAPTNAGAYKLVVSVADSNATYTGAHADILFTIGKATVTITADSKSAYVGDAKPALTYTATGKASSDTLTTEPTLEYESEPDMSKAGSVKIKAKDAVVPNTDNYESAITYVDGTLTISTKPSGGGGGGSSSGGSSSTPPSGGSAGGVTTPGKTVIDNPVGNQGSKNTLAEAVKNAIATGKTNSTVFTNFANYTALTKDGLKAINDATAAAIAGKNVQLSTKVQLDNKVGNAVVSRITIDPVKLATVMPDKLSLGVWFDQKQDKQVTAVKEMFERAFDNNMVIVTFEQKDPLTVDMEFAAKLDLSKLDTKTLYFYSYNPTTNLYYRILSPNYWVDKNGYTHFTAPFGGSVVISDKPLTKK